MKFIKIIIFFLAFAFTGLTTYSCNNSTEKTEQKGKAYTSEYVCPMHCEGSGSDSPGECPVCGMDYVERESHMSDGHTHN